MINLEDFIDIHIHTSPDVKLRKLDDIDAAKEAKNEKMKAIVLKSHFFPTADRAIIVKKLISGIDIFGSLTLNEYIGGINPFAVDTVLKLGGKVVWLPTTSAQNHRQYFGLTGGISFLNMNHKQREKFLDILQLICDYDAALGTGHISKEEIVIVINYAKKMKLKKIIITHPEVPWINLSTSEQKELSDKGVYFERCLASTFQVGGGVPVEKIIKDISIVGFKTTIISTDFGSNVLPKPVDGYKKFLGTLTKYGFESYQLDMMGKVNPSIILGYEG